MLDDAMEETVGEHIMSKLYILLVKFVGPGSDELAAVVEPEIESHPNPVEQTGLDGGQAADDAGGNSKAAAPKSGTISEPHCSDKDEAEKADAAPQKIQNDEQAAREKQNSSIILSQDPTTSKRRNSERADSQNAKDLEPEQKRQKVEEHSVTKTEKTENSQKPEKS